jgi:hypothetical protein
MYRCVMCQQPVPGKTASLRAHLEEATPGAPRSAVVFKNPQCIAALKSQNMNGLFPSHTVMKNILEQVHHMRSKFRKLTEDAHTNVWESFEALYNRQFASHNMIQKLSKENAVLLLVNCFDRVEILEERPTRLHPKTRHNSKIREQVLRCRVTEGKEKGGRGIEEDGKRRGFRQALEGGGSVGGRKVNAV